MTALTVYFGDNLPILRELPAESVDLIYVDPPFNTGKVQRRMSLLTVRDEEGDRTGFQGKRYRTVKLGTKEYADIFDDYLAFIEPRMTEARRVLKGDGSLFFHIDYREVHYAKVLLDFFAGSGSFGEAAVALGRKCILIDNNEEALRVMGRRFANTDVQWIGWTPEAEHDTVVQGRLFACR